MLGLEVNSSAVISKLVTLLVADGIGGKVVDWRLSGRLVVKWYIPVWVRLCILRFSLLANTFPQPGKGHGKGFSPVCTRIWFTNLYLALKGRPLRQQPCQKQAWLVHSGPPTCSTVMWVTISCMELNNLLHVFLEPSPPSIHKQLSSCLIGGRM